MDRQIERKEFDDQIDSYLLHTWMPLMGENFLSRYVNVAFTKNTEKYVKYSPADVSTMIDKFFDVAA